VASAVLRVTPEQFKPLAAAAIREFDERCAADPWFWLCNQVRTIDEATQTELAWPADKEYLRDLTDVFVSDERKVAFPKSRRMLVTWCVAALCAHRARYSPGNAIFWQSQNEQKAAYVVDKRCAYIEDHLAMPGFRLGYHAIHTSGGLIGKMEYHATKSYIWAVPQGSGVFRSFTPSVVVVDESDFQDEGHDSLAAAIPMAEKKTKLVLISSSNGPRGVLAGLAKEAGFIRFR